MRLEKRELWGTAPPEPRSRISNWPTVLFSWWCTSFAAVIIITRVLGRKVRSNKLFREDWIMLVALIPLFVRMIFIHFVLIYGTNNVDTTGFEYTEQELYLRSIGSRLVLPARIFYAMFIWISKLTISEFLKRITIRIWRRRYEATLQGIRVFLFVTFAAVVVATLSECRPFHAYWQVIPDPGPQCRQGYAQLLTMGACGIVTDILLIGFPIPVVLASGQSWQRKLQMGLLFSLSIFMIAVTGTRIPHVIEEQGRQQYRTVWASGEILASAAVSNGVILGSFLRDKGTKKNRYRSHSMADSVDRASARRPTLTRLQTDQSDEDLFLAMGCRVPEHLREGSIASPRPAPPALPASKTHLAIEGRIDTPLHQSRRSSNEDDSPRGTSTIPILSQVLPSPAPTADVSDGYFDFAHHEDGQGRSSRSRSTTITDTGSHGVASHDFAVPRGQDGASGSRAFLRDVGGILATNFSLSPGRESSSSPSRRRDGQRPSYRLQTTPIGVLGPMLERQETDMSLQDPGGLLQPVMSSSRPGRTSHSAEAVDWRIAGRRESLNVAQNGIRSSVDDIELADMGDLLSNGRQDQPGPSDTSMRKTPRPVQRQRGFEGMILNDPGGLMRR